MTEREERIDDAVSLGGLLVSELLKDGPLNGKQIKTILVAAVNAKVPNAAEFEIRESAKRVEADLNIGGRRVDQAR
jgi:hypothetical protein